MIVPTNDKQSKEKTGLVGNVRKRGLNISDCLIKAAV